MAFDPTEERDPHGRWTRGAGGELPSKPDPRVMDVGGDEWNKQTAARLENEYDAARPALDKIAQEGIAKDAAASALLSAEEKAKTTPNFHDLTQNLADDEQHALADKYGSIYEASKALYGKGVPGSASEDKEEEPPTHIPESWDDMSAGAQETAQEKYEQNNLSAYLDDEKNNWYENDAPAEQAREVAEDHDWKAEWLSDYLDDRAKETDEDGNPLNLPRIPYTAQELLNAIKINFDSDAASGSGYSLAHMQKMDLLNIDFDDSKLQNPDTLVKDQMQLPGIAHNPEGSLTKDMRADIEDKLREAFWEAADKKDVTPPEYLEESAKEQIQSVWGDLSDKEKFNWVKKNTDMLDEAAEEAAKPLEIPKVFDPMNETSGKDYQDTQRLAKYMADQRAIQVMNDRGIKSGGGGYLDPWFAAYSLDELKDFHAHPEEAIKLSGMPNEASAKTFLRNLADEISHREMATPVTVANIQSVDSRLWSGWKGSSSGTEGRILQVAAADELGGRLRAQLKPGEEPGGEKGEAWKVGGYASPMEYASAKGVTVGEAHELVPTNGVTAEKYQNWNASGKPYPVIEGMAGPGSLHEATTEGQTGTVTIHSGDLIYHDPTIQKFLPVSTAMGEAKEIGSIIDKQGFGAATPGTLQTAWNKLNDAQKNSVANAFYEAHPEFKNINQPSQIAEFKSSEPPVLRGETITAGSHFEVKLPPNDAYAHDNYVGYYTTKQGAETALNEDYPKWKEKGWEIIEKPTTDTSHTYTRLPEVNVLRNGAASMTTDPAVANRWGGTPVKTDQITREEAIKDANTMFPTIGGYEGVKAAVRAKWETTQYLLDKADMPVVQLYRGLSMPHSIAAGPVPSDWTVVPHPFSGGLYALKNSLGIYAANLNGAPNAAWDTKEGAQAAIPTYAPVQERPKIDRVVLRAEVPRTAILSVPAYGINVHTEHEVVAVGAGWKGWDAWSEKAPSFSEVPMAGTTPSSYADKPQTTKDWGAIEEAANAAYHPVKITLTPEQEASLPALKAKVAGEPWAKLGYPSSEAYEKAKATEKWAGYK